MKPRRQRCPSRDTQRGASLIGVLVALVVVVIVALALLGVLRHFISGRAVSLASESADSVESAFRSYLVGRLRAYVGDPRGSCNPKNWADIVRSDRLGLYGLPRYARKFPSWDNYNPTPVPPDLVTLKRYAALCDKPSVAGTKGSSFFFCLALDRQPGAQVAKGSLLDDNRPFALVRVNLRNVSTGTVSQCRQFAMDPAVGAEIFYVIERSKNIPGGQQVYTTTFGSYFATPELLPPGLPRP